MIGMRISVVIWPNARWSAEPWQRAEEMGFDHAWVYDHVTWNGIRPWRDALTTLAAAAAVTSRIRLGTLVTAPNFRHPVPTASAVAALDDISDGRLTLGLGAGIGTSDARILGGPALSRREYADRCAEFVPMLDALLRQDDLADGERSGVTREGSYWTANGVDLRPGCVQRPRVPFAIAATGPRGMALAREYGDMWVTFGSMDDRTSALDAVRRQVALLDRPIPRMLLAGQTDERWLDSYDHFQDLAGRYAEAGITDIILHWPDKTVLDGRYDGSLKVLEQTVRGV